jgi:glycosyltransferase involved in cell wall biosynthesis
MTSILADGRWRGPHGIGRFATEVLDRLDRVEEIRAGLRKLHPFDPWWVTRQIRARRPGVYFSPGFNPPWRPPVPFVFCVHDLIHLHEKDESSPLKTLYYRTVVRPAVHRAARVLTGSRTTRDDILQWSGASEERVTVVHHGVSPAFTPHGEHFAPGYPYLLYVGNSKPHKNVDGLLRGLAAARRHVDVRLVLVGVDERQTQSWARDLGLVDHLQVLSGLSDETLAEVTRGAQALVLPSRHEGFGLPILEAMACGTPVVASRRSAIPEAAGGAGLLVDCDDPEALAASITEVCTSSDTREDLRRRGLQRVVGCTWEATARQVQQVLEESVGHAVDQRGDALRR